MDNSWCLPSLPQNPFERENARNLMETDRSKKVVMFILQMAKNSFQNFGSNQGQQKKGYQAVKSSSFPPCPSY